MACDDGLKELHLFNLSKKRFVRLDPSNNVYGERKFDNGECAQI